MVSGSMALVKLAFLSMGLTLRVAESREPDGLVVVSRHGVRRQFPSSNHDFAKYAPGKTFATTDEVCVRVCVIMCCLPAVYAPGIGRE